MLIEFFVGRFRLVSFYVELDMAMGGFNFGSFAFIFTIIKRKTKLLFLTRKFERKVVGFDANALYLWAIGQDMLCGDHEIVDVYPGI